ncbi:MAG: siphovirus Gp157 family protein, partial [Sporomusa sp.]
MAHLYVLGREHEKLSALIQEEDLYIDPDTGEVIDGFDFEQRLADLQLDEEQTLEGMSLHYKNLKAEADAIKAEEKALAKRRKQKEAEIDRYWGYINNYMINVGKELFETARCKLKYFKSRGRLEINNPDALLPYAKKHNLLR